MMKIGGLQKHSFIDYPGRISCVLFLSGCNFECPYCHNPQLAGRPESRPEAIGLEEVFAFLEQRRGWLEGVVISGGEPTLHADLPALCRQIKDLGYSVKLDTNGSRPQMLQTLVREGLVDYLAMDIKTEPEHYRQGLARQCDHATLMASLQILMDSGVAYEFRTTCVRPLVTPGTIAHIARLIAGSRLYALQTFRESRILHPEYFQGLEPSYSPEEMDGLRRIAAPWVCACAVR
jgi:pyruvate formate lyase activating enzyme